MKLRKIWAVRGVGAFLDPPQKAKHKLQYLQQFDVTSYEMKNIFFVFTNKNETFVFIYTVTTSTYNQFKTPTNW